MQKDNEIWRPVVGYEDKYLISNNGTVKSLFTNLFRKQSNHRDGYKHIGLSGVGLFNGKKKGQKQKYIHRLVAEAFIPNPNFHPDVNHIDGNKANNHMDNLEWSSEKQNTHHAYKTKLKRILYGEEAARSKLTQLQVDEIRTLRSQGLLGREIAEKYNISITQTFDIINNKSWSTVKKITSVSY